MELELQLELVQPPQDHPEANNIRVRDTLLVISKALYFIHHFLLCAYTIMLLILQPKVRSKVTLSLFLIIIYGLTLIQLIVFNFLCIIIDKQKWAVWTNRFFAKISMMVFPIFAAIAYTQDHFLHLRSVRSFMIYHCIVSFAMIIYELYSCTCGHHREPGFLYHQNDLKDHYDDVWNQRKQFNSLKLKRIQSVG